MRERAGPLLILPPIGLFVAVMVSIYRHTDLIRGLDFWGNLDYVRYVDFTASLPLADRGFQFYHPPAYYVLTAGVFELLHRLGFSQTMTGVGRGIALLALVGEGILAILAVRAIGGGWLASATAVSLVWLLPGQTMLGAWVYNETLTGLGVALMMLGILQWSRARRIGLLWLGLGFAVAVMSKYSGLAAAAVAIVVAVLIGRARWRITVAAFVPGVLLAVLFYGRNLIHFGTPLPFNSTFFNLPAWDPVGWGHPPGFWTNFSLSDCSARHSFWTGFWKWWWATDCYPVKPWRDVVGGKLLAVALVSTIVLVAAIAWASVRSRRDPVMLYLAGVPVAVFLAFIAYNIRTPGGTLDKGLYLLLAIVPLAVATGLLLERIAPRLPGGAIAYAGVLGWSVMMVHASGLA